MNIQCKRVYDPAEQSDGYRVLVDRLWPRGIKKTDLALDEWDKEITPSTELRKAFHGEAIDFAHFSQRYRFCNLSRAISCRTGATRARRKAAGGHRQKTAADPALLSKKHHAEPCAGAGRLAT